MIDRPRAASGGAEGREGYWRQAVQDKEWAGKYPSAVSLLPGDFVRRAAVLGAVRCCSGDHKEPLIIFYHSLS